MSGALGLAGPLALGFKRYYLSSTGDARYFHDGWEHEGAWGER